MGADESMRVHISDVTINQLNAFVDLFFPQPAHLDSLHYWKTSYIFWGRKKSNFLWFVCKRHQAQTRGVLAQLLLNCPTSTLHQNSDWVKAQESRLKGGAAADVFNCRIFLQLKFSVMCFPCFIYQLFTEIKTSSNKMVIQVK